MFDNVLHSYANKCNNYHGCEIACGCARARMSCILRMLKVSRARGVQGLLDVFAFASTCVVVKFKLIWEFCVLGCFFVNLLMSAT